MLSSSKESSSNFIQLIFRNPSFHFNFFLLLFLYKVLSTPLGHEESFSSTTRCMSKAQIWAAFK